MGKRQPQPNWECEVDGCEREAVYVGLCSPCYAAEFYWQKKGIAARRKRRKNLAIFAARMDRMSVPTLRRVK